MKTKLVIMLLMLLASVSIAEAKFVQEVELKDGTVLVGYVYKQRPGKSIVFHSSRARKDPKTRYMKADKDYTLQWKDVKAIKRSTEADPSWCVDKVTLRDGTVYTGQITEQQLGVSMTMQVGGSPKPVIIKYSDLLTTEKVAVDLDHDLWLDRQYTNRLRLADNSMREGLIVLQYKGLKPTDSYLELLHASGYRERIYLPDISEYIIQLK